MRSVFRFCNGITLALSLLAFAGGCAHVGGNSQMLKVYQTARDTDDRLSEKPSVRLGDRSEGLDSPALISIDTDKSFQTITGFGGAFTEAAAYTLSRIDPELREKALRAYFDPKDGIGYSLCRTHINSCDFALGNYAYNEIEGDVDLRTFDISRDRRWLIPPSTPCCEGVNPAQSSRPCPPRHQPARHRPPSGVRNGNSLPLSGGAPDTDAFLSISGERELSAPVRRCPRH